MKSTLSILLASIVTAGAALAADEIKPGKPNKADKPAKGEKSERGERPRANPEEAFKKLDGDSNGSISLDEYKSSPRAMNNPARAEETFKRRDKDGDSKLSLDEFKARGQRRERGAPPAKE